MKKVINKGYTLTVTSWENDADNYKTLSKTFDTKEEALDMRALVLLSDHSTTHKTGLGNGSEWTPEMINLVKEYIDSHKEVVQKEWDYPISDDDYIDTYYELSFDLMGSSEWYISRVHESSYITYSPEDIYLEEIK